MAQHGIVLATPFRALRLSYLTVVQRPAHHRAVSALFPVSPKVVVARPSVQELFNRNPFLISYSGYMPPTLTPPVTRTQAPETSGPAPFESWGRYPTYSGKIVPLNWQGDFPAAAAAGIHNGALPVGMGRSYGDVCLLKDGNLLLTTGMNRLLDFDPATGLLTAEAGITLAQILDFAVPRGFLPPRHPGNEIRHARRRHRQRHPRQEPPRRGHLRLACHPVRPLAL